MLIHLRLALAGLPFSQIVIQPIPYSSSLHSSISISVSDLSRLCEGKGFRVGDGCLKSEENETHRYIYKRMQAHMHTFTNKHRHILREAAVWWTALAFGRRHDKVVERSGRERRRVAHWMERWRGVKGIREGNVKDQCHQDCGPVFVSVATYHSIVCLLRTRQCAERVWRGVGWGLVRVRLWISKGKVGERGWGETHGSAIYNIGGGVRLGEGLCVFVCVCCILIVTGKVWLFAANVVHAHS